MIKHAVTPMALLCPDALFHESVASMSIGMSRGSVGVCLLWSIIAIDEKRTCKAWTVQEPWRNLVVLAEDQTLSKGRLASEIEASKISIWAHYRSLRLFEVQITKTFHLFTRCP